MATRSIAPVPAHSSRPAALPSSSRNARASPLPREAGSTRPGFAVSEQFPPHFPSPASGHRGFQSDAQRRAREGDHHADERAPAHVAHLPAVLQHHLQEVRRRSRFTGQGWKRTGEGGEVGGAAGRGPAHVTWQRLLRSPPSRCDVLTQDSRTSSRQASAPSASPLGHLMSQIGFPHSATSRHWLRLPLPSGRGGVGRGDLLKRQRPGRYSLLASPWGTDCTPCGSPSVQTPHSPNPKSGPTSAKLPPGEAQPG